MACIAIILFYLVIASGVDSKVVDNPAISSSFWSRHLSIETPTSKNSDCGDHCCPHGCSDYCDGWGGCGWGPSVCFGTCKSGDRCHRWRDNSQKTTASFTGCLPDENGKVDFVTRMCITASSSYIYKIEFEYDSEWSI